ncbi:MAG: M16 family metallopeptidase [Gemmatimonadaceae bacterium]
MIRPIVAAVLAVSAAAAQSPAQGATAGSGSLIRDTVLANGLRIIVSENHAAPIATTELVVRTGAFTQDVGEEGISHLFEHLLFRAYGRDQAFATEVADMQGTYNGSTAEEEVNYYITAPGNQMGSAVHMLAKLIVDPRFRDADIDAERAIVRSEFDGDASQSSFILRAEMGRRLWGADWAHKDALGTAHSIDQLDPQRVRAIYARYYVPNNAALVVAGDVHAADVFTQAAKRFGGWKTAPDPLANVAAPSAQPLATQTLAVSAPHQRLVAVTIEWVGPSVRADATGARAAELFAQMVNSTTSALQEQLVHAGLVQSASMSYLPQNRRGPISLTVVMLPAAVEPVLPMLRAAIERFASPDYLNESLLAIAKKEYAMDSQLEHERASDTADDLGFWWAVAGLDYARADGDATTRMSMADVAQFVKTNIAGRPYVAGALTAPGDVQRVRQLIDATFHTDKVAPQ